MEYKSHPDFPNYQVYEDSRVIRNGRAIAQMLDEDGYLRCILWHKGKRRNFRVHRLVAELFVPGFSKDKEVHHQDRKKTNNKADNLLCLTRAEHAYLKWGVELDEITVWNTDKTEVLYIACCVDDAARYAKTSKAIVENVLGTKKVHPLANSFYFDRF